MGRRKNKISKPRKITFAIVVDGETEVWYFQMFKRNEPDLQVNIEPKIPQKKKLSEQYEKVIELAKDYEKVFWIIDLDKIIEDSKIVELKSFLTKLEKEKFNNVITIFNNPCLEFWFILHYEQTTKYFPKCKEAENQLKKYLKDYEKTRKYFTRQDNDIYLKLKPNLSDALRNTKNTKRESLEETARAICEMNLFFENEHINNAIV